MKMGDTVRRDVIRFLWSAIGREEVDRGKRETGLTDEEVLMLISRQIKQRKDSISQYDSADRKDLADKERTEASILETYLPKQLTEEEIKSVVTQTLHEVGTVTAKDMGKVMGLAMAKVKGVADGTVVRRFVQEALQAANAGSQKS